VPRTEIFDLTTLLDLYFLVGYMVAEREELHEEKPPQTAVNPAMSTIATNAFAHFFILQ
jgi:hypothetical protein